MSPEQEGFTFPRLGATVFLLGAAMLSFQFRPLAIGPHGIDAGWQWVVNVAGGQGWAWGSELVFTYGPLGWLLAPQDIGLHLLLAAFFAIGLQVLMFVAITRGLLGPNPRYSSLSVCVFSILWVLAANVGLRPEGTIVLVGVLLCLDAVEGSSFFSAGTMGLLAALCLVIKASLGVSCLILLLLLMSAALLRREARVAAFGAGGFFLGLAFMLLLLFQSVEAFRSWVSHSFEIIGGYSTAASILGPRAALLLCLVFLVLVLLALGVLSRRWKEFRFLALLLLIPLLISFRLAFVRQDGHQFLYVPLLISCLAVLALKGGRRTALAGIGASLVGAILASLIGALPYSIQRLPQVMLCTSPGPASLAGLIHLEQTRRELRHQSQEHLRALRIRPTWTEQIRGSKLSVIPWEMLYAPANGLKLCPLRSMQLYSAYTAELDRWTAEGFEGKGAPEWILDDFAPVGKRRALLDAPATWRSILINYHLEDFDREWGILLLKRRPERPEIKWRDLGSTSLQPGSAGVQPPRSDALVFAEIQAPLNIFGRLNSKFFRVPLLLAVFHRDDGSRAYARLIAATAANGILVNEFPRDLEGYAALWGDRRDLPVRGMEIIGPGVPYYAPAFHIRWRELVILSKR